jgi:putative flippase GtrA
LPRIFSGFQNSRLLRFTALGLLWASLGFGLTHLLEEGFHFRPFWADVIENLAVGLCAGFFFWQHDSFRRRISQRRATTVAELNHHIRNALQIITYSRFAPEATQLEILQDATTRIDAVLTEVTQQGESGL